MTGDELKEKYARDNSHGADDVRALIADLEAARKELGEWERGDVSKANRLMADRCIVAEREARDLKKAEIAWTVATLLGCALSVWMVWAAATRLVEASR